MISARSIVLVYILKIQFQSRNRVSCDFCDVAGLSKNSFSISFNLVIEFLVISAEDPEPLGGVPARVSIS